ncbi:MAG: hypothetical protein ABJP48_02515 [Erythrobacter sp.]
MRNVIVLMAGALALSACDLGTEDEAITAELAEKRELMDSALFCMKANNENGQILLALSEIEDDQAEAAEIREQAEQFLPPIEAFESYARNRSDEMELTVQEFETAEAEAAAWFSDRHDEVDFEQYVTEVVGAVSECKTDVEAGKFD